MALEDGQSCRETRALAEKKLRVFERRLADLRRMQKLLKCLIGECDSGKQPRSRPTIATLAATVWVNSLAVDEFTRKYLSAAATADSMLAAMLMMRIGIMRMVMA